MLLSDFMITFVGRQKSLFNVLCSTKISRLTHAACHVRRDC